MVEQINFTGDFFIENIKFKLGITNNITKLPFIEITENGLATKKEVQMLNLDKKIFMSILYVLPLPALKIIFNVKQGCRRPSSFYGYTYQSLVTPGIGFSQVMANYNKPEEQLFIFIEANFDHDMHQQLNELMGKFSAKQEQFNSIFPVSKDLEEFQAHCEIGNILYNLELWDEALVEFRISLKLEGKNPEAFLGIGGIFEQKGEYDKALKYYLKTKNFAPDHPAVHRKLGDLHYKMGKPDQAIEDYSRVIEISSDSLITGYSHFSLGIISEEKNKLGLAIRQYKKAIKLRPNYDYAYYKLGTIYFQKGDFSLAIKNLEKAISLRPNNFLYYDYLGLAYSKAENFEKAIWAYKMALKLHENDIRTLINLGFSYSRNDNFKFAILAYRKALELNPENPEIYYHIGLAYVSHGQSLNEALNFYKKALTIEPKHVYARNQVGLIYFIFKDYPKAIKEFQLCITNFPGFALAYKNLGLIYNELKKYENAIDYYSKCIILDEADFECFYNRGLAYNHQEEWKNAVEDFKAAEKLNPNSGELKEILAKSEKAYLMSLESSGILKDLPEPNLPRNSEEKEN